MNNNINWAMKKNLVVYGIYGIILPNYVGLKMNYKDPSLTTQYFMHGRKDPAGCFSVAQMEVNGRFRHLASPNIYYFTDFLNPAPPPKKKNKNKAPTSWHCFLGKIDPKDEYQPVCFMFLLSFSNWMHGWIGLRWSFLLLSYHGHGKSPLNPPSLESYCYFFPSIEPSKIPRIAWEPRMWTSTPVKRGMRGPACLGSTDGRRYKFANPSFLNDKVVGRKGWRITKCGYLFFGLRNFFLGPYRKGA